MSRLQISLLTAFMIAIIVHLSIILLIPILAPQDVWTRLEKVAPTGDFHVLPAPVAGDPDASLFDPSVVMALCRYDLKDLPFRITGDAPPWYWSLSLHTNKGFVFYAINNRAINDRALDLRILTEDQYVKKQQLEVDEASQEFVVPSLTLKGYVVLRALIPDQSARERVEQNIKTLSCQPFKE